MSKKNPDNLVEAGSERIPTRTNSIPGSLCAASVSETLQFVPRTVCLIMQPVTLARSIPVRRAISALRSPLTACTNVGVRLLFLIRTSKVKGLETIKKRWEK